MASPVLIIPREIKGAQAYLEVMLGDSGYPIISWSSSPLKWPWGW
jgi:hypothetical protein